MLKQITSIATLAFLLGCSSSSAKKEPPNSLLDVLTDFSVALNENKFQYAVGLMTDEEQAKLFGPNNQVSPEVQKQLKALKLQKLIKNPKIQLQGGKLTGIYNALPSLEHGEVRGLNKVFESIAADSSKPQEEPGAIPGEENQEEDDKMNQAELPGDDGAQISNEGEDTPLSSDAVSGNTDE